MKQVRAAEDWRNGGFGLYVHWPFCASKCPYCDFNSHVAKTIDHRSWAKAYVREIERIAILVPDRPLGSLFFGGGTPSTMEPETVKAVIDAARRAWPMRNSVEITLEANPTSVDFAKFSDFAQAGINRVSLGIQALDDDALRLLGRKHSVKEALRAWEIANKVFERSSFDLIYARQHQSADHWKAELHRALKLVNSHMSLYQLTIEEGTAFGDRYKVGKLSGLPNEDVGADLFDMTQDLCGSVGLMAYEVSNHALPGEESRHNLTYWRYGDYVGIGPGAHGRLTLNGRKYAIEAGRNPDLWLKSASGDPFTHETQDLVDEQAQATEYMLMGLRLTEGLDIERWKTLSGQRTTPVTLPSLIEQGLLWQTGTQVGTTQRGRSLLNSVLGKLLS